MWERIIIARTSLHVWERAILLRTSLAGVRTHNCHEDVTCRCENTQLSWGRHLQLWERTIAMRTSPRRIVQGTCKCHKGLQRALVQICAETLEINAIRTTTEIIYEICASDINGRKRLTIWQRWLLLTLRDRRGIAGYVVSNMSCIIRMLSPRKRIWFFIND